MDSSIDGGSDASDGDLPVDIGTLELDGTRPKVGDTVDVKVGGTISKIVNETAYVTPVTVNDAPLAPEESEPDDQQMQDMAGQAGAIGY